MTKIEQLIAVEHVLNELGLSFDNFYNISITDTIDLQGHFDSKIAKIITNPSIDEYGYVTSYQSIGGYDCTIILTD